MISKQSEEVLNRAVKNALDQRHEYLTLEHVFLSLLSEPAVKEALESCGGIVVELEKKIAAYLKKQPKNPEGSEAHPVATLAIQRLIQRALFQVQSAGKDEVMPLDMLVAIFQSKDSRSAEVLKEAKIQRIDIVRYVSHGKTEETAEEGAGPSRTGRQAPENPLAAYCLDLNALSRQSKIDPLVGRSLEIERMIQTLCRRRKNNPLLVGEAGVGKTALAEGLATAIVFEKVPDLLAKAEVYSLDLGALLAGTKFRGDFEQRLKGVIKALKDKVAQGKMPILYIDEIHNIIGAGAVSGGTMDAAHLLKPLLTQGEIRVMGSTTYTEYRSVFEKDHALVRRFQKIDVVEPTIEEAIQILKGLQSRYEGYHRVQYTPEAIRSAVELTHKHIRDRFLPDKAIDIMDEAGARMRLKAPKASAAFVGGEATADGDLPTTPESLIQVIDVPQIEELVASIARIPPRSVNTQQKERLKNLERDLKIAIYGQDQAVGAMVNAIRLARSGLRTGDKPIGNFLFCGPTGVGKTELSKQLAHNLGVHFARFDMSEYGERHTVSRLIGAPPGYVGFEQAGLLTDAVLKNPHAVVLLDEIEKAHPEIFNILLQVMDHGTLTDNNGKKADFRNVVLIMTSNVGSREMERRPLGMMIDPLAGESGARKEVERMFTPEFRNRLDSVIFFNPLDAHAIAQVVNKQLMELENQLLAKNIELEVSAEVRDWLAVEGYDRKMGARPLGRVIQEKIKKPLAEEILFGSLEKGGTVKIEMKDGKPEFIYTAISDAATASKTDDPDDSSSGGSDGSSSEDLKKAFSESQ